MKLFKPKGKHKQKFKVEFRFDPRHAGRIALFTALSALPVFISLIIFKIAPQSEWSVRLVIAGFILFLAGPVWVSVQKMTWLESFFAGMFCVGSGLLYGISLFSSMSWVDESGTFGQFLLISIMSALYAWFVFFMGRSFSGMLRAPKPDILSPLWKRAMFATVFMAIGFSAISWWSWVGQPQFQDYLASADWVLSIREKLAA